MIAYASSKALCDETLPKQGRLVRIFSIVTVGFIAAVFVTILVLLLSSIAFKTSASSSSIGRLTQQQSLVMKGEVSFPADPFLDATFGSQSLKRPDDGQLEPDLLGYLAGNTTAIKTFLQSRLIEYPDMSGYLSSKLKTSVEVIKEAQRIHYNMFGNIIGRYKYCMLFDLAEYENKGHLAITVGEIFFLTRCGLQLVYYCKSTVCDDNPNLLKTSKMANSYSPDELIIFLRDGGNISGYKGQDFYRFKAFKMFKGYKMFMFPQSIWRKQSDISHFEFISSVYCCSANVTIVLRDMQSYLIARKHFKGDSHLLLAPDMAFHIGPVRRFVSPVFDILWIKREDGERPPYASLPDHPSHLRLHFSDWLNFKSPEAGNILEQSVYTTVMGFFFIQRGRVVVTERLHGHILATLANIPHVLLDNGAHKLSSYHNTWTASVENTRIAENPKEAIKLALELLDIYKETYPHECLGLTLVKNLSMLISVNWMSRTLTCWEKRPLKLLQKRVISKYNKRY